MLLNALLFPERIQIMPVMMVRLIVALLTLKEVPVDATKWSPHLQLTFSKVKIARRHLLLFFNVCVCTRTRIIGMNADTPQPYLHLPQLVGP